MTPAAQTQHRRLRPATRGDVIAFAGTLAGLAIFLILALWAWAAGLVTGAGPGFFGLLPGISTIITLIAFAYTFLRDWRWLHREERDITNLLESESFQRDPRRVLEVQGGTGKLVVQTILDDRVAKLLGYPNEEPSAPLMHYGDLRAAGVARVAPLGSFARFVSGLLLLLTVLGTFVGVKQALPQISAAFLGDTQGVAGQTLQGAMDGIANAFGSNLVALIGCIALGAVSFGFGLARQNTLARLEQATSLYVYPKVTRDRPEDLMSKAVLRLSEATTELAKMGSQFDTVSGGLEDLGTTIEASLRQTRDAIQALLAQQALQIEEQERRTIDRLERQLSDTAVSVQQSVGLYSTMVGNLDLQARTLVETNKLVAQAASESAESRRQFAHYAEPLARSVESRLEQLQRAADAQAVTLGKTATSYETIANHVVELGKSTRDTAAAIQAASEAHRKELSSIDGSVASAVTTAMVPPLELLSSSIKVLDARLASMEARPAAAPVPLGRPDELLAVMRDVRDALREPWWRRVARFRR